MYYLRRKEPSSPQVLEPHVSKFDAMLVSDQFRVMQKMAAASFMQRNM
jgi:hypothetical protein